MDIKLAVVECFQDTSKQHHTDVVTTVITAKTRTCKRLSRVVIAYLFIDSFSM